jgi:hypothetical protein
VPLIVIVMVCNTVPNGDIVKVKLKTKPLVILNNLLVTSIMPSNKETSILIITGMVGIGTKEMIPIHKPPVEIIKCSEVTDNSDLVLKPNSLNSTYQNTTNLELDSNSTLVLLGTMKLCMLILMVLISILKLPVGVTPMLETFVDLLGLITSMMLMSLLITLPNS